MAGISGPNLVISGLVFNIDSFNYNNTNFATKQITTTGISTPLVGSIVGTTTWSLVTGAWSFPSTDYLQWPSNSNWAFGTGNFTIEVWIYPTSFSTYTHMVALPEQNTFALKANVTNGQVYFYSATFNTDLTAGWSLTLNEWNHIVLKRESNVAYGYKNAVLQHQKSNFNNNFTSQILNIHNGFPGEFATCSIRAVRIYNRALSDSEIENNYRAFSNRTFQSVSFPVLSSTVLIANQTVTGSISFRPVSYTGGYGTVAASISPTLPTGLSISQDGTISGLPTQSIASTTFTVTFTDQINQTTSKTFNLTVAVNLYSFTTFTFTNAGTIGRLGPTQAQLLAAYDTANNPWLNNTAYYQVTAFNGYQLWTVPESANYQIQARGASSGSASTKGAAALITATVSLTQGQKIWIICGQRASAATEVGEGASWVVLSNNGAIAGSTPLVVAGGAGDYSFYTSEASFQTGQAFADAQTTDGITVTVLNAGALNPLTPTTGNGGTINNDSGTANPSGGGGFNTDGDRFPTSNVGEGRSFFSGLFGGLYQSTIFDTTTAAGAGFGGGGARNGGFGTGGGGGYTGGVVTGSQGQTLRRSTGGSSYVVPGATNVTRSLASAGAPNATLAEGQVVITRL